MNRMNRGHRLSDPLSVMALFAVVGGALWPPMIYIGLAFLLLAIVLYIWFDA